MATFTWPVGLLLSAAARGTVAKDRTLALSGARHELDEQDHRAIQRRVRAKQQFRSWHGAQCAIAGYEAMHMIRKGQARNCERGDVLAQIQLIHALLTQATS